MDISEAVSNTQAIASATERVTTAKVLLSIANNIREGKMPPLIEIKGLGEAVRSAKAGIAAVRSETAGLSSDATALVTAIQDVRAQINQAQSDLKFEAETLGNGGAAISATGSTVSAATAS